MSSTGSSRPELAWHRASYPVGPHFWPELAALTLVLALTAASGALGPELSGLLAPFPIVTSVLAVFTHARGGPDQVRVLLRNFLVGFYGFAAFCFVLAIGLPDLDVPTAFIVALLVALVVQAVAFVLRARLEPAPQRAG